MTLQNKSSPIQSKKSIYYDVVGIRTYNLPINREADNLSLLYLSWCENESQMFMFNSLAGAGLLRFCV